jgi:two-component system probable response regulator PhcQ
MEQYTVLFVDDEPFILNSLKRLFRGDPINVLTAGSANEALQIMRGQTVHLLVTDNIMPGMCGVELAKLVKQSWPDTFRILLSGQSDMEAVLKAINEGEAYRFILKPWTDFDLKATINIALAHYKLTCDNERLVSELKAKSQLLDLLQSKHPELFQKVTGGPYELTSSEASPDPVEQFREDTSPCRRQ